MKAQVGDQLILESHHLDVPRRIAEVIGLEHDDGRPPYRVRWLDNGHEALFFPGADCHVEPKIGAQPGAGS